MTGSSHEKATSPYDSVTEEFNTSVPRTDEDLDVSPEIPALEHAVAAPTAQTSPSYDFASIPPAPNPDASLGRRKYRGDGRGTLDLGLLVLRLAVGATFLYLGMQKLGWWGGAGVEGTKDFLAANGWKYPGPSGIAITAVQIGGGALLILGLLTPVAAGALVAAAIDSWLYLQDKQPGLHYDLPSGIALVTLLGAAAASVILTGPGRIALDGRRDWATRPRAGSFFILIAAIAAAVVAWIFLHGGNPLD